MLRIIMIFLLCFVVINLFVGLFYILRGKKTDEKAVRALTIRVAASVALFLVVLVTAYLTSQQA